MKDWRRLGYLLTGTYLLRRFFRNYQKKPEQQTIAPSFSADDLRRFLPTFLSQGSQKAFVDEIRDFLKSEAKPYYTSALASQTILFQGDGLKGLPIINLPDPTIKYGSVFLLSNTCDMDATNQRLFPSSLTYSPIFPLNRYLAALSKTIPQNRVSNHEKEIRGQLITQILFLPQGGGLRDDSIVFLDRIVSASNSIIQHEQIPRDRLFTLSDFGAWLLALKLSVHFCRIRDRVDRHAGKIL